MIKINLLPYRDIIRKKNVINHAVLAGSALVATLLLILIVNLVMTSRINGVSSEIVRVETEIASNKKIMEEIEKLKAEKELYRTQFEIIEKLKKDKKGPVIMLDELAKRIPDKIWLISLKQKGSTVELQGAALDNRFVSKFMSDLEASPFFSRVDLITTEQQLNKARSGKRQQKIHTFTLTCSTTST
jgi:type IV pilus assembly protein PilN